MTMKLTSLTHENARRIAGEALAGEPGEDVPRGAFLLLHHQDRVRWGRSSDSGICHLVPEPDVNLALEGLLTLRIFNTDEEVLIWSDPGTPSGFAGRLVRDSGNRGALEPVDRTLFLDGDRITESAVDPSWTTIRSESGLEQTVPLLIAADRGPRQPMVQLRTRNYLEVDQQSGAVSIVLTRFVQLEAIQEGR